jgi:hypothetical protein
VLTDASIVYLLKRDILRIEYIYGLSGRRIYVLLFATNDRVYRYGYMDIRKSKSPRATIRGMHERLSTTLNPIEQVNRQTLLCIIDWN